MIRFTALLRFTVHSPRGINFALGPQDAIAQVGQKYGKRRFGAKLDFLELKTPSKEFLPFYICNGHIHGTFTATVGYSENSNDSSGKSVSRTRYVHTQPLPLNSIFEGNRTQLYAGYKYNINHIHYALRDEDLPNHMQKLNTIDTTDATLNLFEQSTSTLRQLVEQEVKRQAEETATSMVRQFHTGADSISINFSELSIKIDDVIPVFVPCYVIKANYDEEQYTMYVSGTTGRVGGPYLLNALYLARTTGLATVALGVLLVPNKVAGLIYGSMMCIFTYYIAFYAAKYFPSYRRDYLRKQRAKLQQQNRGADTQGFRPSASSERIRQEYHNSSYWDSHAYQQKSSGGTTSSTSGGARTRVIRDPKGYYAILGLHGDESVNDIRSAYRILVLKQHPDIGGSTETMAKINEAYRVLRDPKRRAEYDQQ